jgi:hypothetical protein
LQASPSTKEKSTSPMGFISGLSIYNDPMARCSSKPTIHGP